jgi:dethiobiotin synthetase
LIRLGITGTDTGVGKTVVACGPARAFVRRGLSVVAMMPIATGVAFTDPSRDGARLASAAGHEDLLEATAPIVLRDPVAPLVAARRTNALLELNALARTMEKVSAGRDVLIVEGAGGVLVPVTEEETYATLFRRWSLGAVVVAVNRLGVINHVRLTCAACRAKGLAIHAVVLNQPEYRTMDSSVDDNQAIIAELEAVPVISLPRLAGAFDVARAASAVEQSGLADLLLSTTHPTTIA